MASGPLTPTATGVYGAVDGTVAWNLPGDISFTAPVIRLQFNTTPAQHTVTVGSDSVTLDPQTIRVVLGESGQLASLNIAGQSISGIFGFEQVPGQVSPGAPAGTPVPKITRIFASQVSLSLGTVSAGVRLNQGSGLFVLSPAGVAGQVSGHFAIVGISGFDFSGDFTIQTNTTLAAVNQSFTVGTDTVTLNLPAGPYLRIEGTGVQIIVSGQRLSGDFTFEQATDGGASVTRIVGRNVSLSLGDGTTTYVSITDGFGFFLLKGAGVAGRLSGTVSIQVPSVSLTGMFALQINTTGAPVTDSIAVGTQPTSVTALASADVNGDHLPDLLVGTPTGLLLYLNDGSGDPFDTIPAVRIGPNTDNITAVAVGDLNGDGAGDVVVGRSAASTIAYLNDGHGNFGASTGAGHLGTGARSVSVGDLDGTHGADVVVAAGTGVNSAVTVYLNSGLNSDGSWAGVGSGSAVSGSPATDTTFASLGDLNHDGKLDLYVASGASATADVIRLGVGNGTFTATGAPTLTDGSTQAVLADVDGNGWADVIRTTSGGISIAMNSSTLNASVWNGIGAFTSIAGTFAFFAKILFFVFLVLFVVSLIAGRRAGGPSV